MEGIAAAQVPGKPPLYCPRKAPSDQWAQRDQLLSS